MHAPRSACSARTLFCCRWYDIFQSGTLYGFNGYQHESNADVAGKNWLVVDPLGHCQGAAKYFHGDLIVGRVVLPVGAW